MSRIKYSVIYFRRANKGTAVWLARWLFQAVGVTTTCMKHLDPDTTKDEMAPMVQRGLAHLSHIDPQGLKIGVGLARCAAQNLPLLHTPFVKLTAAGAWCPGAHRSLILGVSSFGPIWSVVAQVPTTIGRAFLSFFINNCRESLLPILS
jgi:hypothetical protein